MFKKFIIAGGVVAVGIGAATIFRESHAGPWHTGNEEMFGKTVIVTGANTGLGKEAAREFAYRGGRVIMACRDMEKCAEARERIIEITFNKQVHCRQLDLASFKSIREFADHFNKNEKRLDLLVNNAGVMMPPKRELTEDGIELQLGVNFLGPFLLTNLLLDKVKASAPSRIINVTCTLHNGRINLPDFNSEKSYDPKKAYDQSKLALFLFSEKLRQNLQGSGVSVFSVHPGICKTELHRHMPWYTSMISKYTFKPFHNLMSREPLRGIQSILHCTFSPDLDCSKPFELYCDCRAAQQSPNNHAFLGYTNRLWITGEVWTEMKTHPLLPREDSPPAAPSNTENTDNTKT